MRPQSIRQAQSHQRGFSEKELLRLKDVIQALLDDAAEQESLEKLAASEDILAKCSKVVAPDGKTI